MKSTENLGPFTTAAWTWRALEPKDLFQVSALLVNLIVALNRFIEIRTKEFITGFFNLSFGYYLSLFK